MKERYDYVRLYVWAYVVMNKQCFSNHPSHTIGRNDYQNYSIIQIFLPINHLTSCFQSYHYLKWYSRQQNNPLIFIVSATRPIPTRFFGCGCVWIAKTRLLEQSRNQKVLLLQCTKSDGTLLYGLLTPSTAKLNGDIRSALLCSLSDWFV